MKRIKPYRLFTFTISLYHYYMPLCGKALLDVVRLSIFCIGFKTYITFK